MKKCVLSISLTSFIVFGLSINVTAMNKQPNEACVESYQPPQQSLLKEPQNSPESLNLLYQALADLTISVKRWQENGKNFCCKAKPKSRNTSPEIYICSDDNGFTDSTKKEWVFGGRTIHTTRVKRRCCFSVSKEKCDGWSDLTYDKRDQADFERLIACMYCLHGDEIGFAKFLWNHGYFK